MNIAITGTSSGVGKGLWQQLEYLHNVVCITRNLVDLSDISAVGNYNMPEADMLINCAGTDRGGKIDFVNQDQESIIDILHTNVVAPVLLSKKALATNPRCKIVNITSTNNKRYWPNNLAYSLSKKALAEFGNMLQVEYPTVHYLEIQLGLTKTNFNQNRYVGHEDRFDDVYVNPHLTTDVVVEKILRVLFDPSVKFVEIAP
jgi:short-subunit dehydrogenase